MPAATSPSMNTRVGMAHQPYLEQPDKVVQLVVQAVTES
jgi:hypothetical protein